MKPAVAALAVATVLAAASSYAQSAPPPPPVEAPVQAVEVLPPPPPPPAGAMLQCPTCEPTDADRAAVEQATELLAQGRADEARRVLQPRLQGQSPWVPSYAAGPVLDRLAVRMAARLPLHGGLASAETPRAPDESLQPRSTLESVSLYTSSILFGVGTGVWLDVVAGVEDIRVAVIMPLVFGGVGAGALWLGEHNHGPLRRGRGLAMSNGLVLGTIAGTLLGAWGGSREYWTGRGVASTIWGGAALGVGLGIGLGTLADVTPASASFVGSGGLWGAAFGAITALAANASGDGVLIGGLVGEGAGIVATAALASAVHPAEAQVRWMDLGVLSGGLVGAGIAVLAFGNSDLRTPLAPALITELGMIGGGVLGYVLGRPTQPAQPAARASLDRFRVQPMVVPANGGAQVMLSLPNLL